MLEMIELYIYAANFNEEYGRQKLMGKRRQYIPGYDDVHVLDMLRRESKEKYVKTISNL